MTLRLRRAAPLLLAAIEAVASIRPEEAPEVLDDLLDSEDEEIADAVAGAEGVVREEIEDVPVVMPAFRSYTNSTHPATSLIYGEGLHDVGIVGEGVIDGQGAAFACRHQP